MISQSNSRKLVTTLLAFSTFALIACSPANVDANKADVDNTDVSNIATNSSTTVETTVAKTEIAKTSGTNNADLLKDITATVYKDASCGCCKEWLGHAADHGMTVTGENSQDLASVKTQYNVPDTMRSCHTTVTTEGYVFEGHVPAKYGAQFLQNPPEQALGLAVPGMPMGSPGMEYQDRFDPYQVMQMNKDGTSEVYADITTANQQL